MTNRYPLHVAALLFGGIALSLPTQPAMAQLGIATKLKSLTDGKRVKLAWQQDQSAQGNHVFGGSNNCKLLVYDTQDDKVRVLMSAVDDYTKPLISHDGRRVVYTDRKERKVRVVDWTGSQPKQVASGFAGALWYDAATGKEWVYVQEGGDATNAALPIKRYNLDKPTDVQLVWNQTQTNVYWLSISGDGKRLGSCWPWSKCGIATPRYDGSGKGDLAFSGNGSYQGGCWTTLAPDNTYRFGVFDGAHRNWYVYDWPSKNKRTIKLDTAPGIDGWEVYHPKHSNLTQFITMTGPYSKGPKGSNNIGEGGPQVEVYFGKLDSGISKITDWVKVTSDNKADFFPSAWIATSAPDTVRIQEFSAQPTTISSGQSSTLTFATEAASKVTISPGVGDVEKKGTRKVVPTQTTTYTLTATGNGGPVSREVTVTVTSETPKLSSIGIDPEVVVVGQSAEAALSATPRDQFGQPIAAAVEWSSDGGGTLTPTSSSEPATKHETRFQSDGTTGTFTVTAQAEAVQATATIAVQSEPTIVITSPTAGDRWPAGSTQHIRWSTNLEDVTVEYSLDGGETRELVTGSVDTSSDHWGSYPWTVPQNTSNQAMIRIKGYFGEAPTESEAFQIVENDNVTTDAGASQQTDGDAQLRSRATAAADGRLSGGCTIATTAPMDFGPLALLGLLAVLAGTRNSRRRPRHYVALGWLRRVRKKMSRRYGSSAGGR